MLKLNASFAKKVPTEQKFSSQSFHASIECELPAGQTEPQLRQKIHETFELVKASVEEEIAQQTGERKNRPQSRPKTPRSNNDGGDRATGRQITFLLTLGRERQMGLAELNQIAVEQFKAESIYMMTKRDVSKLIDQIKIQQAA